MGARLISKPTPDLLETMDRELMRGGRLQVLPSSFFDSIDPDALAYWLTLHGIYGVPTVELIAWLEEQIGDQLAIEIGAGNGALARALDIPATDSHIMLDPEVRRFYAALNQPVTEYGDDVEKLEARYAIDKYKPEIVVGSWVTQKWLSPKDNGAGSVFGVNEEYVIRNAKYILIGHDNIHKQKRIMAYPHKEYRFPWLVSRSHRTGNMIAIWDKLE